MVPLCIDYKSSEDYEETVYDVFQDKEEELSVNTIEVDDSYSVGTTDEDYEAAWDNYERQCYEWD